jgi:hypothetical protein
LFEFIRKKEQLHDVEPALSAGPCTCHPRSRRQRALHRLELAGGGWSNLPRVDPVRFVATSGSGRVTWLRGGRPASKSNSACPTT